MRVVLLTSSYLPVLGGLQEAVSQLGRESRAQGHEVLVVANRYPRMLQADETIDGIRVRRMFFPGLHLESWRPVRVMKHIAGLLLGGISLLRLVALLRRFRPDVVNIHFLGSQAPFGLLAARRFGVRCVVSLHGDDVEGLPHRSWVDRRIFQAVLRRADHVTACSRYLLGEATKLVPQIEGKATAIWNGIRFEEFENVEPYRRPRPYIFAAGRLVEKKGFDILLRAYRRLIERGEAPDLIIAGDGPQRGALIRLAQELGLAVSSRTELVDVAGEGRVLFWGRAERKEMARLLRGCQVFAIPSRLEPFGIVALEALAAGCRIVASRTGGLAEIAERFEQMLLCEPDAPEQLAMAICAQLALQEINHAPGLEGCSWRAASQNYLNALS